MNHMAGRVAVAAILFGCLPNMALSQAERPRAREVGLEIGIFEPGRLNAITDVEGVKVGHRTIISPPNVLTGITAILPHSDNLYSSRVPAAIHVGNGFGKLLGVTQVRELGEIETPILLTCTLCVWQAADAMVEWMLQQRGMDEVRSINPVVGETNDGTLNDIRSRPISPADVVAALEEASTDAVDEGAVGAGAGTIAFGWKGGIGTSSRVLPQELGGYTIGVIVQSNFGGVLQIGGAPVGVELEQYSFSSPTSSDGDGSIMIVVATNAPLLSRNLERIAKRAIMGLARTGSFASNGSGDYVIAFSTAPGVRRSTNGGVSTYEDLANTSMSSLFAATVEATEEAIYNSLFKAETASSNGRTVEALPLEATLEVLRRYGIIR